VLVLYQGATITSKDNKITNISFSKSDFSLVNLETNTTTYKKTQEISSTKLIRCIKNYHKFGENDLKLKSENIENCSTRNMNNIFKELYKRFVIPLYIPLLSLIPFLIIIISKENSKYQRLRIFTFLIGFFVIVFSEITIRFISNLTTQNIMLTIIPIIFLILFYFYLFNKFNSNSEKLNS
jgi:lipopolysaccharide export system permease protein